MSASSVLRGASFVLLWIPFASQLFVLSGTYAAEKFTPEHPLVQEMVNKGMGFLNKSGQSNNAMYNGDHSQGTSILTGYTIYKVTSEVDHPLVVRAVGVARKLADESASVKTLTEESVIYTISLAGVLLATVDVEKHATQILRIRDYLLRNQKPNGGFGYATGSHAATGDISQTQYATLALWTMGQHNIEIPQEPMIRLINFMIGAQTQDGGFPYQSNGQPGGGSNDPTNSLCAAGLSALLIAGDGVGLYRNKLSESQDEEGIIPTAFKRVMDDAGKRAKVSIDRTRSDSASKRSEDWFANHPYTRAQWHYYYTYSKERYESFLEITKGKQNKSPDWYNNGVLGLRINQGPNGEWGAEKGSDGGLSPELCTSFAILFLIRSSQKAIGELNDGLFEGVGELPDDPSSVTLRKGKIVDKTSTTSIDEALKMLEDDGKSQGEDALVADRMLLATDPKQRKEQLNRFSRLLNARDFESRRIAAKLLGRGDDLDYVPSLIYALSDPDPKVPFIAEQSLRLVSRQLDTYHLPKREKISDQDRAKAAIQWKKWYLGLRPDYIFLD